MAEQELMVKATPLQAVLDYMNDRLSPEARERVFAEVAAVYADPVKIARSGRVLATERFPLKFTISLVERSAAELRLPATEVAYEIGRRGAESASKGVMRLALTMISMPSLLRKLEPTWTQLYSQGHMSTECTEKSGSAELRDFPLVSATFCARVTGWFAWFAEKAEKTAKVSHPACRAKGDAVCRWRIDW